MKIRPVLAPLRGDEGDASVTTLAVVELLFAISVSEIRPQRPIASGLRCARTPLAAYQVLHVTDGYQGRCKPKVSLLFCKDGTP